MFPLSQRLLPTVSIKKRVKKAFTRINKTTCVNYAYLGVNYADLGVNPPFIPKTALLPNVSSNDILVKKQVLFRLK